MIALQNRSLFEIKCLIVFGIVFPHNLLQYRHSFKRNEKMFNKIKDSFVLQMLQETVVKLS